MRLTTETNVLRSACRALLTVFYYSGEYQSKRSTKRQTEKWETVSLMHTAVFFILDAAVKSCLLTCTKLTQEVFFFCQTVGFFSVCINRIHKNVTTLGNLPELAKEGSQGDCLTAAHTTTNCDCKVCCCRVRIFCNYV